MKRTIVSILAFSLVIGAVVGPVDAKAAKAPKLNKTSINLVVGKKASLKVKNTGKKVKWSLSKTGYATLSAKKKTTVTVKAKKKGTVYVIAKVGSKKLKCKLKVKAKTMPTPAAKPTTVPTTKPTAVPTAKPTAVPTAKPTAAPTLAPDGNLTYSGGITTAMCKPSYWTNLCENPDKILMSTSQIQKLNQDNLGADGTNMHDLANMTATYNGTSLKNALASETTPTRSYYVNGQLIDNVTYFAAMKENIQNAQTTESDTIQYGLCTKRADMKAWPTDDVLGYSVTDADDELESSALNVNEPFVIKAKTADGKFYWGRSTNCSGWVLAENMAICDDKAEWLDAWQGTGENILVVTTNKIVLEPSNFETATSKVELMIGTELNLVPEDEIPDNIAERGTWNNYVVYVPTRDENGKYVKKAALISQHYNVSVGYLPLNQRNLMNVAFECLGDRYGWGGMLGAMDCALYTRSIYKCFGIEMPRNTTWQQKMPVTNKSLTGLDDSAKRKILNDMPAGSLLFFTGHTMMYLGHEGNQYYVISALGSVVDNVVGAANVQNIYSVTINSLDVKRKNGSTWLTNLTSAVCLW